MRCRMVWSLRHPCTQRKDGCYRRSLGNTTSFILPVYHYVNIHVRSRYIFIKNFSGNYLESPWFQPGTSAVSTSRESSIAPSPSKYVFCIQFYYHTIKRAIWENSYFWTDVIKKVAGSDWVAEAEDRRLWRNMGEA